MSATDGVWVQGYHWLRAVSQLFPVCVCVIIHNHEHMHLFGDTDNPRIYLYKRDTQTHYDALVPSVAFISGATTLRTLVYTTASPYNNTPTQPTDSKTGASAVAAADDVTEEKPYTIRIRKLDGSVVTLQGTFPVDSTLQTLANEVVKLRLAEVGSFCITFPRLEKTTIRS